MRRTLGTTRKIVHSILWVNSCLIQLSKINAQCTGNGLVDCACNFIKACKWDYSTKKFSSLIRTPDELNQFIPSGLEELALDRSQVAQICEPGSIGIFYDCRNRIPLASTIVMTEDQYNDPIYNRVSNDFSRSRLIGTKLQQTINDYHKSLEREPCYEKAGYVGRFVDQKWYAAIMGRVPHKWNIRKCSRINIKSPIHKGHLIAAQYGRSSVDRVKATFVYTNAVPQFGSLNSGSWEKYEQRLILWARRNCKKAPMHIIVGSVPSTFRQNERRFIGEAGFSNFLDRYSQIYKNKGPFRVNVPAYMWTAACCHTGRFTRNTAFYAENHPGRRLVQEIPLHELFSRIQVGNVELFPKMASCSRPENFENL